MKNICRLQNAVIVLGITASITACASAPSGSSVTPLSTLPIRPIVLAANEGDRLPDPRPITINWGPLPPGQEHPLPALTTDLQHQVIRVQFDWSRKAVVGLTVLRFAALDQPVSSIELDAVGMEIKGVRSAGQTLEHKYDGQTIRLTLPKPLAAKDTVSVIVEYEAVGPKKGAYFIDRKHVVWTQGEIVETRHWVPTIDRPDDKTTWEMYITVPEREKVLSNGRLRGIKPVGNDREWHWSQEKPAATYLLSFVTGDYTIVNDRSWNGIPISYWTYPDSVEAAKRGFKGTPHMIDVYARLTGVPYPWAKYDQAAAPDFLFGGMENVSATTQNDQIVLIPASEDTLRDAQPLVSHEIAHQWFGNLVTLRDWSHAWLNEGFATFSESIYFENSGQPDRAALNRVNDQQSAIAADMKARRPLVYGRWASNPLELFLSGHIYPKGAAVLDMLRVTVGEPMFWKSVNTYLTKHAYQNVVTEDLRSAFETTTGKNLKAFFDQWVYGAGFPILTIEHGYDPSKQLLTITATQVQRQDSLTGLFTMDVDVDVMTDQGTVRGVAQVRGETTTLAIPLQGAPRAIRWDVEDRWLDIIDFPRSTNMLLYQLQRGDVLARAEAIALLKGRLPDEGVTQVLRHVVDYDPSKDLRNRAEAVLSGT